MLKTNKVFDDLKSINPDHQFTFQQDGAPAHRTKTTMIFLKENMGTISN
jgi:hypothetical protein